MIFRIFLGLTLVIFLVGFSLTSTLFPKRDDLEGTERAALSLILSFVVVPLLGLILNFTPYGIKLIPILVIISAFMIMVSIVAWTRRMKLPAEERFRVPFDTLLKVNLDQSVIDKSLSIILIASIIGSFATLTYVVVVPKIGERFTEFYLLGPNGMASDYPTDLKVGEAGRVIICIVNREYENVTYRLEAYFNGSLIYEEQVSLIGSEKWEEPFTFKAIEKGEIQNLEFLLYKDQQIEAYRTLHLFINVK